MKLRHKLSNTTCLSASVVCSPRTHTWIFDWKRNAHEEVCRHVTAFPGTPLSEFTQPVWQLLYLKVSLILNYLRFQGPRTPFSFKQKAKKRLVQKIALCKLGVTCLSVCGKSFPCTSPRSSVEGISKWQSWNCCITLSNGPATTM